MHDRMLVTWGPLLSEGEADEAVASYDLLRKRLKLQRLMGRHMRGSDRTKVKRAIREGRAEFEVPLPADMEMGLD